MGRPKRGDGQFHTFSIIPFPAPITIKGNIFEFLVRKTKKGIGEV